VIVIVFGVSGAGKTTVGKLLAEELGWHFCEGDDFHPRANVEKMRAGQPLTDEDRWPWLERLRRQIIHSLDGKENAVFARIETRISKAPSCQPTREICLSEWRLHEH
jgi:gluconokinase